MNPLEIQNQIRELDLMMGSHRGPSDHVPLTPAACSGVRKVYHKPVLFLDIDGVLNTFGSQPNGGLLDMHPHKVAQLQRILDTVPTDVVLSSTWRMFPGSRDRARAMMDSIGYDFLDYTPEGPKMGTLYTAFRRADEIKLWLSEHPDRTRFVVLDDDVFPADFPAENLVTTDGFFGGLTEAKANEVIRKLNGAPAERRPLEETT
jgi:hypothetical protein